MAKLRQNCKAGEMMRRGLKSVISAISAMFITGSEGVNDGEFCTSNQPLQLALVSGGRAGFRVSLSWQLCRFRNWLSPGVPKINGIFRELWKSLHPLFRA